MPTLPQPKGHVSTARPGYTHGVYYCPDVWPFVRFYMHTRGSFDKAAADAYALACVDDTGYYFVVDYATGETVYKSRDDGDQDAT
jgi:hypothetical protein